MVLPLILSVLIQSVRVSGVINDLQCSGLVINYDETSFGGGEYGYPAGVCWSYGPDESVILQCDDNGITVIEYPNDNCSDDDWQISYPTNGCSTWGEGVSCESYCTGFTGCEYFTVKEYDATGCNADGSPTSSMYYWTRIVAIDYCYAAGDLFSDDDTFSGYIKFTHENGAIMQSSYLESTCATQDGVAVTFGEVGATTCEVDADGEVQAQYIEYGTASDDKLEKEDISVNGQACIATGDPHFITFNGGYHHFQGQNSQQYYYIAPCKGWTTAELPFTILATHSEWTSGSNVMGVEDLVLELYDTSSTYLLFVSPSHNGYIQGTTYGTKYADNKDKSGYVALSGGEEIGSRFTFSRDGDLYTITIDDDADCAVQFKFEGRTVTILPPLCYKEYICGLCGDFDVADGILKGCDNEPVPIDQNDETFWENPIAFDTHGNGWEKSYFDDCRTRRRRLQTTTLVYTPTLPENFTITNPCNASIESLAAISCQTARANAAVCCDTLGSDFCDSLQEDCAFDACVSAGNDATAIDGYVAELFTDAVNSVCTIPDIESVFSTENLTPNQDTTSTTTEVPSEDTVNAFSMVYSMTCISFCLF
eukprot:CAMPEP_0201594460 /NCGR_PEP_ID=MMETSP0190_2-20130828/191772_1 /ASSEMBLY_ACC=CAM_ASM_000263 /TAXON_ID=37353 /ORGANISM="Rosalina sp." /LENGTH=593 /DNA_ID=CAMNT_0048054085 /DNA_START=44 /DNA_END=1822 /DNA_ORIENTATION=+